ncbi:MAG: hypothetical protein LBH19_14625 [Dysgonamonadaceae bacterium]|nr:hypothetical protein [Dysgonamonadaceae bacterium]
MVVAQNTTTSKRPAKVYVGGLWHGCRQDSYRRGEGSFPCEKYDLFCLFSKIRNAMISAS